MEGISEVRGRIIESLQDYNATLKKELLANRKVGDDNEQKSRSSCLLIHGVEEANNEDTDKYCLDIVNKEVGVDLCLADIERSHRIGPRKAQTTQSTRPRPIIVRFASMRKRMEVYRNKKRLKGKDFVITESLTSARYDLYQKAKNKFGVKNTWTSKGRIFTKIDNIVKHIDCAAALT